jgi:hypothetical protein
VKNGSQVEINADAPAASHDAEPLSQNENGDAEE